MQSWKTLSRRTILDYSQFLTVEEHAVELPDGRVISDWPWVITPDFVNVVAQAEDGRYLCFRQGMLLRTVIQVPYRAHRPQLRHYPLKPRRTVRISRPTK